MGRFTTATFTTGSVAPGGGTLDYDLVILSNIIDICRIKITPSIATGNNIVAIYKTASRGGGDLLYVTEPWADTEFIDPADTSGVEFNQGWVCPYYDDDQSLKLHFRFTNNHTVAKTFDVEIDYEYSSLNESGVVGSPEDLRVTGIANGLTITTGCQAMKNTSTITEAEFRAIRLDALNNSVPQDLRLVSEGGTFVPDGVDKLQVIDLFATPAGANYSFVSVSQGKWYYAWRLKNSVGWSRWSDGNINPSTVMDWVKTQAYSDTGAPSDWEVWLEEGPQANTVVVHATRPKVNGNTLMWWFAQVKDADSGSWIALDSGTAPSEVKYDGSLVAHATSDRCVITKNDGLGWGTAASGDLVLIDYRGLTPLDFGVNFCLWAQLKTVVDNNTIEIGGPMSELVNFSNLTIKIVKPPWSWTGSGYLGAEPNMGFWGSGPENDGLGPGWILGNDASEFSSNSFQIPAGVTNPEARVWFQNLNCRSDNNLTHSTGMGGGTALIKGPCSLSNFNDRNYWLPIYPMPSWGTLTFSKTDGSCLMATKTGNLSHHYGRSGIFSRFSVSVDELSQVSVYAKFTNVTLPVGIDSEDVLMVGIFVLGSLPNQGSSFDGAVAIVKGTDSSEISLNAPYVKSNIQKDISYAVAEPLWYPGTTTIPYPASGSTLELIWTRSASTYRLYTANNQYRIGGSGAYTSKSATWVGVGYRSWFDLELFIGIMANCRLTGFTAKLTQVSILNGNIEFV